MGYIKPFRFLTRYQTNQVIIKIGKISNPGTSSSKDMNPIKRNMAKQVTNPTTSRKSPINGSNKTAAMYSLTSRITQIINERSSVSVKTTYLGRFFLPAFLKSNHTTSIISVHANISVDNHKFLQVNSTNGQTHIKKGKIVVMA